MTQNNNDQKYGIFMLASVALAFCVILTSFVISLARFADLKTEDETSAEESSKESIAPPIQSSENDKEEVKYEYYDRIAFTKTPISNSNARSGSLILIDGSNSPIVSDDALVPIHSSRTGKYDLKDYSLRLNKEAMENIDRLIVSFYSKYKNNGLGIAEGYVSSTSGPERDLMGGYSVKFTTYKTSNKLSDEDFSYLKEQAFKYGVIQRYPDGKNDSTNTEENLSIYRYVGLVHSCYMNHYNLSLEEYIDKIKTEKVIEYRNNYESNAVYVIYYVPIDKSSDTTYVNLPSDEKYTYSVSGDGGNGYIVTVKIP